MSSPPASYGTDEARVLSRTFCAVLQTQALADALHKNQQLAMNTFL